MSWSPQIHFKGDIVEDVLADPDRVYGPSEPPIEESFKAIGAEYDAENDVTTVTLKPITRTEALEQAVATYGDDLDKLKRLDRAGLLSGTAHQ
ncbi:hypothetical protein SEA_BRUTONGASTER_104 [Gordonia phage BrutonGaster]|uniref:Uncharacterized protein n=1 Tax=Gordonia phage BrutonGaster TaxID=2530116 RepID=A0A482JLN9_9CAUD|nr:hypothetical protein HOV26_gp078 [Gordonia phage BrutonGaster]QBP33319.1 hypothetical protein SEA_BRUTONGASTER_104 [Gordonia phage BrutonGaster]